MQERPTHQQVLRVLQQHLTSLRQAGIEWLPESTEPLPIESVEPVAEPVDPIVLVKHELEVLADEVSKCARCPSLASTRTQTVFGVGNIDQPEVCFIGEAPGADEDAHGEPFVGAAGQMLNRIIAACGWRREEIYICNIVKCRPPRNRAPTIEEAHNCREYLDRQLELVNPHYICALGGTAIKYLLDSDIGIGRMRGKLHSYKGIPVVCTYHPAYLLVGHHNATEQDVKNRKRMVWDDMKFLLTSTGRQITPQS